MQLEKQPRVGDQVIVDGREGVFFVLNYDGETRCVSLLPSDDARILDDVSVDTLTIVPNHGL